MRIIIRDYTTLNQIYDNMIEELSSHTHYDTVWLYSQTEYIKNDYVQTGYIVTFDEAARHLGIRARLIRYPTAESEYSIAFFDMMDYLKYA